MIFEKVFTVTEESTAQAMNSGDLPVLATPALVAKVEETAKDSIQISEEETTVGSYFSIDHLAPTVIGRKVYLQVELMHQGKKSYNFSFSAFEGANKKKLIAKGDHRRVRVPRQKFLEEAGK